MVLGLSKTWLDKAIEDSEVGVPGINGQLGTHDEEGRHEEA